MAGGTQVPVGGCRIPKPEEEDQEKKEEIHILDYRFKNKDKFLNSMPPGYKFSPTDKELILYYLRPKIENKSLPINRILEVNIYKYDPEDLTALFPPYGNDNDNDEWFFFTPRDRKYPNGMRPRRGAGKGYWKVVGADKVIKYDGQTIGFRKTLDFYRGKPPKREKTNWIMYEFRTNDPPRSPNANTMRLDDVVLSKIYKKRPIRRSSTREPERVGNEFGGQGLDNFDIMNEAFGNCSFDASNNYSGNVPGLDARIDFGNVHGFNSTDYGNPGLNPRIDNGNDAAQMSSNMNGNLYGHGLLHGRNNNGQIY